MVPNPIEYDSAGCWCFRNKPSSRSNDGVDFDFGRNYTKNKSVVTKKFR